MSGPSRSSFSRRSRSMYSRRGTRSRSSRSDRAPERHEMSEHSQMQANQYQGNVEDQQRELDDAGWSALGLDKGNNSTAIKKKVKNLFSRSSKNGIKGINRTKRIILNYRTNLKRLGNNKMVNRFRDIPMNRLLQGHSDGNLSTILHSQHRVENFEKELENQRIRSIAALTDEEIKEAEKEAILDRFVRDKTEKRQKKFDESRVKMYQQ